MIEFIKKHRFIVTFILLIALFLPFASHKLPEADRVSVITSVGIDKKDDKVEVSVNTIVPSSDAMSGGFGGTVKTITTEGENISEAFSNLTLVLGKEPGLAHCDSIVLSKQLFEDDVTKYLDYFMRTHNLTSNASLIVAEDTAKDIIETTASQQGIKSVSLSDILLINKEYVLARKSNIDYFYSNYFSPMSSIALPILSTGASDGTDEKNGSESSGGGEKSNVTDGGSGGSGGGQDDSKPKILKNEGKGLIIKKGKAIDIIEGKDMNALSIFSKFIKKGSIKIEDVNNEFLKDADLDFDIFNKKTTYSSSFVNGKPVFNYNLKLVLRLEELVMDKYSLESITAVKNYIKGDVGDMVQDKLQDNMSSLINLCKNNRVDLLGVYDHFYKYSKSEWLKFLDTLEDKDDYLNYVTFTSDIKLQAKI